MNLAGGFTSGREIRSFGTKTEAAANLDQLLPPAAGPRLCGPAFSTCSTGGEPNSDDLPDSGAACFGRIDRSIVRRVERNRLRSFRRGLSSSRTHSGPFKGCVQRYAGLGREDSRSGDASVHWPLGPVRRI